MGWLAASALVGACDGATSRGGAPGSDATQRRAPEIPAGELVARVGEREIGAGHVRELLAELDAGVGARGALDALVEQQLLADEAARRGFAGRREVAHARRNALARRLLEREAQHVSIESLDQERLRRIYDEQLERFVHGPQRKIVHALVRTGKGGLPEREAAQAATEIGAAVADATTEAQFRAGVEPFKERLGGAVKVESLPPFAADSQRFVAPFVAAAFAIQAPGRSSAPVATRFGWHVLWLVDELPARETSFEEAKEIIGRQLVPVEQQRRVDLLIERLEQRWGGTIDERALAPAGQP